MSHNCLVRPCGGVLCPAGAFMLRVMHMAHAHRHSAKPFACGGVASCHPEPSSALPCARRPRPQQLEASLSSAQHTWQGAGNPHHPCNSCSNAAPIDVRARTSHAELCPLHRSLSRGRSHTAGRLGHTSASKTCPRTRSSSMWMAGSSARGPSPCTPSPATRWHIRLPGPAQARPVCFESHIQVQAQRQVRGSGGGCVHAGVSGAHSLHSQSSYSAACSPTRPSSGTLCMLQGPG